ncbi:hypothetical protein ANN_04297 [Periplaneta americana]|uniref:Uncharacterized protein n=1 Tax=Periplaneta americana TaxID=6978 RepID=A0ABQ8T868_PERAM|nr:hypothetical protein ANN_04297 [Periplaneta americana]
MAGLLTSVFLKSRCQRQIQLERSLTPVSKRVGVVGRKREKSTASHNVLVSRIFAAAELRNSALQYDGGWIELRGFDPESELESVWLSG